MNKSCIIKLLIFINLFNVNIFCLAQHSSEEGETPHIIGPSPTAASLGKYAEVPVSEYTGIPSINLDLYQLKGNQLSLPISLSYHSGGVKVEENSTFIGLNWTLNSGGVITRSVRGIKDNPAFSNPIPDIPTMSNFLNGVISGTTDSEPDSYFFNFNSYTGKFFLIQENQNDKTILKGYSIPYRDITIICDTKPIHSSFTVITEDGTQYFFNDFEYTTMDVETYDAKGTPSPISNNRTQAATSWFLTSIKSAVGNEVINFKYSREKYGYKSAKRGSAGYRSTKYLDFKNYSQTSQNIEGVRLEQIRFEKIGTTIEFKANKIREDLYYDKDSDVSLYPRPKALEEIIVKNDNSSTPIKKYILTTGYFITPAIKMGVPEKDQYLYKRLKLESIAEVAGDGSIAKPPTVFEYDQSDMPPKDAETQDHWGFYNGPVDYNNPNLYYNYYTNHYMIPSFNGYVDFSKEKYVVQCNDDHKETVYNNNNTLYELPGVDREPHFPAMQVGILKKIFNSAGGITRMEYEPNDYGFLGDQDYTKIEYKTTFPSAIIPKTLKNKTDYVKEESKVFQFEDTTFIRINFRLEYNYENEVTFSNDDAYTANEIALLAEGEDAPFRIYYIPGRGPYISFYYSRQKKYYTFHVRGLPPFPPDYEVSITDGAKEGNEFGRRIISGYFIAKFIPKVKYRLHAIRQYDQDRHCPDPITKICYENNTDAQIWLTKSVDTDEIKTIVTSTLSGGLRIARQTHRSDVLSPPIETKYIYKMHNEQGNELERSSGCQVSLINHFSSQYYETVRGGSTCLDCNIFSLKGCYLEELNIYNVLKVDSDYPSPLGSTQGSHLGYREVKVVKEGNGATLNKYSSAFDAPDKYPNEIHMAWSNNFNNSYINNGITPAQFFFPFLPQENMDWQRGMLKEMNHYNKNGKLIFSEKYDYTFKENKVVKGLMILHHGTHTRINVTWPWADYTVYNIISGKSYLSGKTSAQYDENGEHPVLSTTNYKYESLFHTQLTQSSQLTSEGNVIETNYAYSADKPSGTETPSEVFNKMINKNILYALIKKEIKKDGTLIKGEEYNFHENGADILPVNIRISQTGGAYETKIKFDQYNGEGNLLQFTSKDNITKSYIWGYNNRYPIAEVINAAANEIAYSGFEQGEYGGWTATGKIENEGHTGSKSFTGTLSKTGLDASINYTISFWAKKSTLPEISEGEVHPYHTIGEWTFYQGTIKAASISIICNFPVDDVRLYPESAKMSTYAYLPEIGFLSETDANNNTITYEYDKLNRITLVRDSKGNIVKSYKYNYKIK